MISGREPPPLGVRDRHGSGKKSIAESSRAHAQLQGSPSLIRPDPGVV
jgi:hypothetical protein